MKRHALKWIGATVLALPLVFILLINIQLVQKTHQSEEQIIKQLRGLSSSLSDNADTEMQGIYPEGYVFMNGVYALAWSSVLAQPNRDSLRLEAVSEIDRAWKKINSPEGRQPFDPDLPLSYGAFYSGWRSLVLGNKLRLQKDQERDTAEVRLFKKECVRIASALRAAPYPESYAHAAWPADAFVCAAALALHDQIFPVAFEDDLRSWIHQVKQRLDSNSMIPHEVDAVYGRPEQNARGSSMSLMLVMLRDIDMQFGREQFERYRNQFVDECFGLMAVREYPRGLSGAGDIDSGPVILGFGGAATIVGMKSLFIYGDTTNAERIRQMAEVFTFPSETEREKFYFAGKLPIADAFLAWAHSGMRRQHDTPNFMIFHLWSLLIFAILSAAFWFLVRQHPILR